ncbi:methyltransferase domain-containing protein [Mesorhizobium sp. M0700]|uniref:class I SAM-dependent methyltransferase n=1 Tax=Mesorhizobium sp. M0700 TaxID=2956988 RepID=UPI00333C2F2F
MNEAASIAAFGTALHAAFDRFKMEEAVIRAKETEDVAAGKAPLGLALESMLERPTRRFLIDPMLRELGWDPDDPHQVTEEARSWAENGDRLYFDYLGLNGSRAPALLVEAKGADAKPVRPPRGTNVSGRAMAVLVNEALGSLKAGGKPSAVVAQWAEWLDDLRTYVRSLGRVERNTLRRVVITAGRWLIIFTNPIAAFIDDNAPQSGTIYCYLSLEEIAESYAEIYRLLARSRLTSTLPLTLKLGEALKVLKPSALAETYRGDVVATRISGGVRGEYPTRAVYPAVVLLSGGLAFAVADYTAQPLEEPREAAGPGTGQATRPLLDLGLSSVVAIEPDERLAVFLSDNLGRTSGGRLKVLTSCLLDTDLPEAAFDLGIAATAFHWVEPIAGLARVRRLLRPAVGGRCDGTSFRWALVALLRDLKAAQPVLEQAVGKPFAVASI